MGVGPAGSRTARHLERPGQHRSWPERARHALGGRCRLPGGHGREPRGRRTRSYLGGRSGPRRAIRRALGRRLPSVGRRSRCRRPALAVPRRRGRGVPPEVGFRSCRPAGPVGGWDCFGRDDLDDVGAPGLLVRMRRRPRPHVPREPPTGVDGRQSGVGGGTGRERRRAPGRVHDDGGCGPLGVDGHQRPGGRLPARVRPRPERPHGAHDPERGVRRPPQRDVAGRAVQRQELRPGDQRRRPLGGVRIGGPGPRHG